MNNVSQPPRTRTPEQTQTAIIRATAKVWEQAEARNLPRLLRQFDTDHDTRQVWTIGSRTTGGTVYTVDLMADANGIATMCDCEAVGICWHRQAARMAVFGQVTYHDCRPTAGRVLTDLHGHGTAPDPWDAEAFAAVS
jgi:hypothetical protein